MKSKYIIIISILVFLVIIYFMFKEKIMKLFKSQDNLQDEGLHGYSNTKNKQSFNTSLFPLKKGDKGMIVKQLQMSINKKLPIPYAQLIIDGDFGDKTEAALKIVTGKTTITEAEFERLNSYFK